MFDSFEVWLKSRCSEKKKAKRLLGNCTLQNVSYWSDRWLRVDGWSRTFLLRRHSKWSERQECKVSHFISWDLFYFVLLLVIFHCMFSVLYSSLTSITVWSTVKAFLIVYKSKAWKFLQLGKVMEFNYNIPDQEKL